MITALVPAIVVNKAANESFHLYVSSASLDIYFGGNVGRLRAKKGGVIIASECAYFQLADCYADERPGFRRIFQSRRIPAAGNII